MSNHDWIRGIGQKFHELSLTVTYHFYAKQSEKPKKHIWKNILIQPKGMESSPLFIFFFSWMVESPPFLRWKRLHLYISPFNNSPVWVLWLWYRIDKVKANLHFTPQHKQSPRERKRVGGRLLSKGHYYCQTLGKLLLLFLLLFCTWKRPLYQSYRPKNKKRIKAP